MSSYSLGFVRNLFECLGSKPRHQNGWCFSSYGNGLSIKWLRFPSATHSEPAALGKQLSFQTLLLPESWLRGQVAVLLQDPGLLYSTHMVAHKHL